MKVILVYTDNLATSWLVEAAWEISIQGYGADFAKFWMNKNDTELQMVNSDNKFAGIVGCIYVCMLVG